MAEKNQIQSNSCVNQSLENQEAVPGMDASATCDNQAEAARHQAGSSGKTGAEFASVDNSTTRKLEP
ncbi:hypothetical protein JOC77_000799 [Peribacillus deserti]|uniref:DUF4025 domain-containing protein n=1 Tax=Peribacillus deserti TaxID=673318 RepID=A0ABS2QEZ4_9BACI|nr:hypothetical protein [Peribacillus deserti]MBM7691394.1 hypothetical protein [Peribacillus deserti]